ncbi:uncharacterized protein LOC128552757, partial [Mercenaria mercenaria]|uniref:uncharacterized protein LOC128552757 n=1 Tax=Mercenaria mercenaria TaxID=6596 RepID=UPI00234F7690
MLASPFTEKSCGEATVSSKKSTLKEKFLDQTDIIKSMGKQCKCKNDCMDKLSYELVKRLRYIYWTMPSKQRKEFVISKLTSAQRIGRFTFVFLDNGQGICLKAFEHAFHINKNFITRQKELAKTGAMSSSPVIREKSVKSLECIAWLESYATMFADRMPNSRDILLPYKTIKRHVYETYVREVDSCVSESTFYGVWTKHFPNLKIKKTKSFSQCTKCAILQRKFQSTLDPVTRSQLRMERSLHNQRQMLERKFYYSKRHASRQHPEDFLSLIIDGMDQSKTDLPHFIGRQAKVNYIIDNR